jgi:hypothetical protein
MVLTVNGNNYIIRNRLGLFVVIAEVSNKAFNPDGSYKFNTFTDALNCIYKCENIEDEVMQLLYTLEYKLRDTIRPDEEFNIDSNDKNSKYIKAYLNLLEIKRSLL